jgi:hypothetical protein
MIALNLFGHFDALFHLCGNSDLKQADEQDTAQGDQKPLKIVIHADRSFTLNGDD